LLTVGSLVVYLSKKKYNRS